MFAKNNSNGSVFTTTYTYGSNDKEYVFSCKGRPFVALVSSSLYTPASTLLDYNLIHQLGLKMTDIQCRKFFYGGHKLRILGRISTAVQCVQNGRIAGNFHIKGLVVSDLNTLLDTHCVAGSKMKEKLAHLSAQTMTDEEEDDDDLAEDLDTSQEVSVMSSAPISQAEISSSPISSAKMSSAPISSAKVSTAPISSAKVSLAPISPTKMSSAPISLAKMSSAPNTSAKVSSALNTSVPVPYRPQDLSTYIPPGGIFGPNHAYLYAIIKDQNYDRYDYWGKNGAEGKPLKLSRIDRKPRIVNLTGSLHTPNDMLRVGDWDKLEDPEGHQLRHILLAKIRRDSPDRVCQLCSYNLSASHHCSSSSKKTHCEECCKKAKRNQCD